MDDTNTPAARRQGPRSEPRTAEPVAVPVDGAVPSRCQRRCWIAVCLTVFALAGMVLGFANALAQDEPARGERSRPVGVYVAAGFAMAALYLVLYAYRQARMHRILQGASWHSSAHSITTTGRGRSAQEHLTVEATGLWYRSTNPLGSISWLKRSDGIEWTGDPYDRIVVRAPGSPKLALLRLEK